MKPWKAASSPVQATPTKSTLPAHFCAAPSTEGASRLQTLQVGAQNQNAVGLPTARAPSNSPPPTNGAVKFNTSGTTAGAGMVDVVAAAPGGATVDAATVDFATEEGADNGDATGVALQADRSISVAITASEHRADVDLIAPWWQRSRSVAARHPWILPT